jgi:hypothetical protein
LGLVHGSTPYEPSPDEYNDTVEIPLPTAGTPTTPLAALCVVCIVITFNHMKLNNVLANAMVSDANVFVFFLSSLVGRFSIFFN